MKERHYKTLRRIGNWFSAHRLPIVQSLLRRSFRYVSDRVEINDFDGNLTLELALSEHMQRRIFWMGYYNRDIVALLDRVVEQGMTVVDVGANIGEITLVAANRTGPGGRVIAFEPVDRLADKLQTNIDRNRLTHATVVRAGLSDQRGTALIYDTWQPGRQGDENYGLGSLYGGGIGKRPLQQIAITTLDGFFSEHPEGRVDLIKIDIEGSELPCLKGARGTLERFRPMLIIEVQQQSAAAGGYRPEDILDYVADLGYSVQIINRGGRLSPLKRGDFANLQNVFCQSSGQL